MKKNNPTQERLFIITLNQHQLSTLERMTDHMSRTTFKPSANYAGTVTGVQPMAFTIIQQPMNYTTCIVSSVNSVMTTSLPTNNARLAAIPSSLTHPCTPARNH